MDLRGDKLGKVYFGCDFERFRKYQRSNQLRTNYLDRLRCQRSMAGTIAGRVAMVGYSVFVNGTERAALLECAEIAAGLGRRISRQFKRMGALTKTGHRDGENHNHQNEGNIFSK